MQNPTNQPQNLLQLEKAYTFFMVPFYYHDNEWEEIHNEKLNKWIPIKTDLFIKEDVLYPYIMNLFSHEEDPSNTRLKIYEFDAKDKGPSSDLFVERVLGKRSVAVIAKNASDQNSPLSITFTLCNESNFAPHIFISSTSQIGILTFAIELENGKDIENLKQLNYYLQKRDEIGKYQCVCLRPDKQGDYLSADEMQKSASSISDLWKKKNEGKACNQFTTRKNTDYLCWDINDFIECLLATMGKPQAGKPRLKYFSKDRIHTFTFCSIDDTQDVMDETTIIPDLIRLSRSVIDSYMLPFESIVQQGAVLKTFENIFFSSAAEGTAMLCLAKPENKPFIDNIHNNFNRQYLLIYLLVVFQRYTLLSLEQKLNDFETRAKKLKAEESNAENIKDKEARLKEFDKELWELIDIICGIKVNCYYTDVSIYTHHSQFYQHCCKNMYIKETFDEIDNKLELLKLTTNKRIQESLEKQRILQVAENNRIKEKENIEKQEKYAAERRQSILSLLVGILTIAQVMQASYELIRYDATKDICALRISLVIGIVIAFLIVAIMRKDIVRFFKN